jgi:hypothetical protein
MAVKRKDPQMADSHKWSTPNKTVAFLTGKNKWIVESTVLLILFHTVPVCRCRCRTFWWISARSLYGKTEVVFKKYLQIFPSTPLTWFIPVLRVRDVSLGSRIRFFSSRIQVWQDLGSWIRIRIKEFKWKGSWIFSHIGSPMRIRHTDLHFANKKST